METRTRIVVYGSSLHMAGIAASLKAEAGLEVICVDPRCPDAGNALRKLNPALLLIGADSNSDELLVLSSQFPQAFTVADLVDVIRQNSTSARPLKEVSE